VPTAYSTVVIPASPRPPNLATNLDIALRMCVNLSLNNLRQ